MIEWQDEGMVLSVRQHGESAVILDVFTKSHGRSAGVVRGGTSRKLKPVLQPGAQVSVTWSARLAEHLGAYKVEPVRSRAANVLGSRLALEGLNTLAALIAFSLPEREAMPDLYARTIAMADRLGDAPDWLASYVAWEVELLSDLGFGLDFSECAATGRNDDLVFVSPKTGRAVSRTGAGEWANRLLILPPFLISERDADAPGIRDGLALTGHFLLGQVAAGLGKPALPEARDRLLRLVDRMVQEERRADI